VGIEGCVGGGLREVARGRGGGCEVWEGGVELGIGVYGLGGWRWW
jgi:hypothetical protein